MRFKSLPQNSQLSIAIDLRTSVNTVHYDELLSTLSVQQWVHTLKHLNSRIGSDGFPTVNALSDAFDYVYVQQGVVRTCSCCEAKY